MNPFTRLKNKNKQKRNNGSSAMNIFLSDCIPSGYTSLDKNPEVITACSRIADLISSMTIHLMANTEKGDQRIINELSRKIDISPTKNMTRKTWMDAIIMNLLLHGSGNSIVLPITKDGIIDDLRIIPPGAYTFINMTAYEYQVQIGAQIFNPEDVLHFILNPDKDYPWKGKGINASIKDVVANIAQATSTEKEFMSSKWKPSLVIKVDGLADEFASPQGRKRLIDEYIATSDAGEPLVLPADQFQLEQIRPLSLGDLAINESVQLDKKTVAAIVGVPAFVLGVGTYSDKEWNNFISSRIRPIAMMIQQEMTKKLILSPKWYIEFNYASLYTYDLQTTARVYSELYTKGLVTGNEVRDKMSLPLKEGLDELVMLENYIPADRIGDQKKLEKEEESENE